MKKDTLLKFIDNFEPVNVLVFGDFMLDHYIWGKVERISPEAPIPILQVEEEQFQVGGAGCCLSNLLALKCKATPMGIYGEDVAGSRLLNILKQKNVDTAKFLLVPNYQTVVKCRVLSQKQQLLRLDYEQKFVLEKKMINCFLEKTNFKNFQVLIISDYLKGTCSVEIISKLIQEARKHNLFVIVDPGRGVDFSVYTGATCIKPNRLEAEIFCQSKLSKKENYLKAAELIQKKTMIDNIVLSLDKEGLLIYQNSKQYKFLATQQKSIFDVTGAGDLVTSMIAIILGRQIPIEIAGQLANLAASVSIKKLGTYNPTWDEIKTELLQSSL